MDAELPKTISGFLLESIGVLGTRELLFAASAIFLITASAIWLVAMLLERKEKHIGAAIASSLGLVLLAGFLGAAYLALLLKGLITDGNPPGLGIMYLCAGVAGVLLLTLVHGAFGTAWWKSGILLAVLGGSAFGAAIVSHRFLIGDRIERLPVLAAQVAGMKTEEPPMIQSDALKKSAAARALRFERVDLKKRQQGLMPMYTALQQSRARLDMKDANAVNAFNVRAAEYHKEKQYVTTRLAQVEALIPPAPVNPED